MTNLSPEIPTEKLYGRTWENNLKEIKSRIEYACLRTDSTMNYGALGDGMGKQILEMTYNTICQLQGEKTFPKYVPSMKTVIPPQDNKIGNHGMVLIDYSICSVCGHSFKRTEGHECESKK